MKKKTIVITHEKAAEILADMAKRKQAKVDNMSAPSKEIKDWIKAKVEETAKMNGEGFDKDTFRLGMWCMWIHLNKKEDVPKEDYEGLNGNNNEYFKS